MKLYRIKRISDGKYFVSNSKITLEYMKRWKPNNFGSCGAFYKKKGTIRAHLHNLCHDWKSHRINPNYSFTEEKPIGSADWSRLDLYEVETITIIDHGEKTQSAKDFMGILENA